MPQSNLLKKLCPVLTMLLLVTGCGSGSSSSGGAPDSGITFGRDYADLFAAATFHPSCVNCHTFNEGNAVSARHAAQNRSNNCSTCHTQDDWRASALDMTTTGKSAAEVCATAVARRGAADLAELLRTSPHVRWAIEDGSLPNGQSAPLAPPGNHAQWVQMVNDWVAGGSTCG